MHAAQLVRQSVTLGMMMIMVAASLPPIWQNERQWLQPGLFTTPRQLPATTAPADPRRSARTQQDAGYQLQWPGEVGDLEEWVVVDAGSHWTSTELRIVHNAIRDTIAALDSAGLDGHGLLAGYRFARFDDRFLEEGIRRLAVVNHESRLIILADRAMIAHQGFYIYHELGHVVDQRLGRRLSAVFEEWALRPAGPDGSVELRDGYWMREQAHDSPSEAAADAFALWVSVEMADDRMPDFPTKPDTVNPSLIFELVRAGLR